MYRPLFIITLLLLCRLSLCAQGTDSVLLKLQKRYNTATAWGNGYIVSANGYYGFANRKGQLVLPFGCRCIDTLLPDRARLCNDEHHRGSVLINADGIPVNSGHNHNIRLVNKAGRIFAMDLGDNTELLANDSGRQLTYQGYSRDAPARTLIPTMKYTGAVYVYGIITIEGDTVLPMEYSRVSVGRELYAGTRNDTGFVFSRTKGLLFTIAAVHECAVLQNDFIVAKKYGMSALVSRQGKLLTQFKYLEIKDFRQPYSIMQRDPQGKAPQPPIVPQFAEINQGQPKGLIDANGKEVLPMMYDNISMNLNGWFIIRKAIHDKEQLTDPDFRTIITADAYDLSFVSERYVTNTTSDVESDATRTRIYDMKLRKYVPKMTDSFKKFPRSKGIASPPYSSENIRIISERYHPDSMVLNFARTCLHKKNGFWGVQSITGDTILPFVYDTAGITYQQFYVGKDNKFGLLDKEGDLAVPVLLPKIPWFVTADSLAITTNKEAYSLKGGILTTLDINSEPVRRHLLKFDKSGLIHYDNSSYGLKTGIYNRRLQLLSERPYKNSNRNAALNSLVAAILDTAGKQVALMDSTGIVLTAWIPRPLDFRVYSSCALAIYDTGQADILFRFDNGAIKADTVFVDNADKNALFRRTPTRGSFNNTTEYGIQFVLPHTGRGIALNDGGTCIPVPGTDKIVADRNYILLRAHGAWALYHGKGVELLPPVYDSIALGRDFDFFLFKRKKMGVYEGATKKITEPVYDTIYYTSSLRNRFLIGHKGATAEFVDDKGRVFSKGWTHVPGLMYSVIGGIPAVRNGRKYKLYPSLGDSLAAIPDETLPEGVTIVRPFMDGTAIVTRSARYGVYDLQKKKWLVSPEYSEVEKQDDFFVATSTTGRPAVAIYSTEGRLQFSLDGAYYPQREPTFEQWYMRGWYGTPVVNNIGKIIVPYTFDKGFVVVPDTFDKAFVITGAQRHLYQAITKKGKRAIFDSSGKMMTPTVLDYIEDGSWMYDGYFLGSLDGVVCLLSPAGKMLTPCMYKELFPGQRRLDAGKRDDFITMMQPESDEVFRPFFIAVDQSSGKFGVIDSTGKTLVPCTYDSIRQVHHGKIAVVQNDGKWGIVDLRNKRVTDIKYDMLGIFLNGTAAFRRADIEGILNQDGLETLK
jgi:hypothetical protein